jgi:hypothetical protein
MRIRRRQIPPKPKKSPTLALVLSAVLPGLGQFYNRETGKALGFLLATAFMAIIFIAGFNSVQSREKLVNYSDVESNYGALVWNNQDLFFAVGPFLLGFIIWSAVDAYKTARGPQ